MMTVNGNVISQEQQVRINISCPTIKISDTQVPLKRANSAHHALTQIGPNRSIALVLHVDKLW